MSHRFYHSLARVPSFRWPWLVAVILLLGKTPGWGAGTAGEYLLEVWNSENGLPDSSVTAVAQTPDGYLWVGTYNGLVRFDGVRFVTFDPANTPALTHARVRRLAVDNRGILWISSYDGSLTRFQAGVFTLERRNPRAAEGEVTFVTATSNQVVFLTSRGELLRKSSGAPGGEGWLDLPPPARGIGSLCCADGTGAIWYRDGDKQLWRLNGDRFDPLPDSAGLAGQNVNCLTTDSQGRLWVGTDQEFAVWDGHAFQSAVPPGTESPLDVECLAIDRRNQVWVVANGSIGETLAGRWVLEPDASRNVFAEAFGRVAALDDHRGGMWFYNYGGGLLHVGGSGEIRQMNSDDGFPGERVYCYFEDREGDWWAGLDAVGLVRVRAPQFHTVPSLEKNLSRTARTVSEDQSGTVWIGRLSAGLGCWQTETFTTIPVADSAGANSVFCTCPDRRGRLWLSAGDEDLLLREHGECLRVLPGIHGVKTLFADHAGRIWVGTTSSLLVSENGSPDDFQPLKGLPRRTIRALTEDRHGTLWGGTANGELVTVTSHNATLLQPDDNSEAAAIWSVLADNEGTIWAGTFRGGLLRFRGGKFTRYNKANGLPDDVICQILDDQHGNLWLGSHQGVFRVAKSELERIAQEKHGLITCVTYGRSDGLPSLECSGGYQPAALRDHAGRLWFTTAKGAAWLQPDELQANAKPPPVVIEDILVDGRTQTLPPTNSALIIAPGRHQIEFHYTGLSLASPERVQFRYQLANLDADWVQAGTRRSAQYGFLPPGNYRFQVIARNSDGIWNETGSTQALVILPHYYETWWFRTLSVSLILGTVAGLVRHTATRRLHRKMQELERKQVVERERARIAKDIHDDLGANLTLIAVLGDLARKEKTAERIEKMSSTARDAVKSLDEIVWAVNPRNDTLSQLVDYTGQFATDYLRDAGIRCLLDVPDHTPAREVPANVRHNVFLVVKEALQNIVKHAHASEVWLRINTGPQELSISIEDNGCGFDRPPMDAWADGLRNMRHRLAEVGGECRVSSQINVGTTITMQLPLPQS